MMCERASVYVSSSSTRFGRWMRFAGGGGGISSASVLLRTRAVDWPPVESMAAAC